MKNSDYDISIKWWHVVSIVGVIKLDEIITAVSGVIISFQNAGLL